MEEIQRIFSSRINKHMMILIMQNSEHQTAELNEETQSVIGGFGGRHHFFGPNTQVSTLMKNIEKMLEENRGEFFSSETFLEAQMKKLMRYEEMKKKINSLETHLLSQGSRENMDELRIVLLGKTGVGKSATGNTILGRDAFKAEASFESVTKESQRKTIEISGRHVTVIDTPGLFDTELSNEEIQREISNCISMILPGPHVFLLLIPLGRFTKHEETSVKIIQETFGEKSLKYTMVLFTRGDFLKDKTIEQCLGKPGSPLMNLIEACGNRFHVFNNNQTGDRTQVSDLLEKIDNMVTANRGSFYSCKMFREMEREKQEQQMKILMDRVKEREEVMKKLEEEKERIKMIMEEERQDHIEERKIREEELKREIREQEKHQREIRDEMRRERETFKHEREEMKEEKETVKKEKEKLQMEIDRLMNRIESERKKREEEFNETEERYRSGMKEKEESEKKMREEMEREREEWEKRKLEEKTRREEEDEKKREKEQRVYDEFNQRLKQEREMMEREKKDLQSKHEEEEEEKMKILMEKLNREREELMKKHEEEKERLKMMMMKKVEQLDREREELMKKLQEEKERMKMMMEEKVEQLDREREELMKKPEEEKERLKMMMMDEERQNHDKERKRREEEIKKREEQYKTRIKEKEREMCEQMKREREEREKLKQQSPTNRSKIQLHDIPTDSLSTRRIVLLGATGVGKSAAGNTILRLNVFKTDFGPESVTRVCSAKHATASGRSVSVVDTPPFFDTCISHEQSMTEIRRSVYLSSPGPHAFLIVLRVDATFTNYDQQIIQMNKTLFGQEVLRYSIILFTRGDQLIGQNIDYFIKENSRLRDLVDQCGGRYHVFNNEDQNNREQVNDLLQKIDSMIEQNGGGHYSTEMFEDAQRKRQICVCS